MVPFVWFSVFCGLDSSLQKYFTPFMCLIHHSVCCGSSESHSHRHQSVISVHLIACTERLALNLWLCFPISFHVWKLKNQLIVLIISDSHVLTRLICDHLDCEMWRYLCYKQESWKFQSQDLLVEIVGCEKCHPVKLICLHRDPHSQEPLQACSCF